MKNFLYWWRLFFTRPATENETLYDCPNCGGTGNGQLIGLGVEVPFCGFCGGEGKVPLHAIAQYQRHYLLSSDEIELILVEVFSETVGMDDIQYAASRIMALVEQRGVNL